jgi:hypothetical protein
MFGNRKIFSTRHDLHDGYRRLTRKIRIDKLTAEEYGIIWLALVLAIVSISLIIISMQVALAQDASEIMKEASGHKYHNVNDNTLTLKIGARMYPLKYQLTGGKLTGTFTEKDNMTLVVNVLSTSNGNLTIELPRNVIDSKKQGNVDDNFTVFEDGQYSQASEIKNNNYARTLMISFDKGTSVIEISGSRIVPEFGTFANGILAMAIAAIIGISYRVYGPRSRCVQGGDDLGP